jgi:hypothetical protein
MHLQTHAYSDKPGHTMRVKCAVIGSTSAPRRAGVCAMRASWTDSMALITDSERDTGAAMKCVGLQ